MYLINLNDIKNEHILNEVYSTLNKFSLYHISYLNYICSNNIPESFYYDFLTINARDFDFNLMDKVKKINNKILIDLAECNEEQKIKVKEILKDCNFKVIQEKNKFDIENITFNDVCIIKDIFEVENNNKRFSRLDFLVTIDIDSIGDLYVQKKKIGNVLKTPFIELITSIKVKAPKDNIESLFGAYLYEPWEFLNHNYSNLDILNYKIELFDKLKNLSPKEFLKLPKEIKILLTEQYYIKWDDLTRIITREDWVLNEIY